MRGEDEILSASSDEMTTLNQAYEVLGHPTRRFDYDRAQRATGSAVGGTPDQDASAPDEPRLERERRSARPAAVLSPPGAARIPWKLMTVMALIGSAGVLISAAMSGDPKDEVPDGILRIGSCVSIEPNTDVREIACSSVDDIVVKFMVPVGAQCPASTVGHRDRLGLGVACIAI